MAAESERPPALDPALVQEFVQKGHYDLDGVTQLLSDHPSLLNAANDWGGGDWETALGAAAHMGRRDIALLLLQKGARIDLFAAAMLGDLEIVRSMVERYPDLRNARGPHTIPLLAHARSGGEQAAAVVAFLEGAVVASH